MLVFSLLVWTGLGQGHVQRVFSVAVPKIVLTGGVESGATTRGARHSSYGKSTACSADVAANDVLWRRSPLGASTVKVE